MNLRDKALQAYEQKIHDVEMSQRIALSRMLLHTLDLDEEDYTLFCFKSDDIRARIRDLPEFTFYAGEDVLYMVPDDLYAWGEGLSYALRAGMRIPITSWADIGQVLSLGEES